MNLRACHPFQAIVIPFILREMWGYDDSVIFIHTQQPAIKRTMHIRTQRNTIANAVVMTYAKWHDMAGIHKTVPLHGYQTHTRERTGMLIGLDDIPLE